jgi:hypothetical protein
MRDGDIDATHGQIKMGLSLFVKEGARAISTQKCILSKNRKRSLTGISDTL